MSADEIEVIQRAALRQNNTRTSFRCKIIWGIMISLIILL